MSQKVLLLGADGFIGRHIALCLKRKGWHVLACARRPGRLAQMGFDTLQVDLASATCHSPEFWRPHVQDCAAIVNAAGLLTGSDARFGAVHCTAPRAIYQAMPPEATGLLISAVGIDTVNTAFARFRRDGEALAIDHNLTILRPGLVLSDSSYGGSSVIRGLAALPAVTPVIDKGDQVFNPLYAADLAEVVAACLDTPPPPGPHDIGGPQHLELTEILRETRRWLGLPDVPFLHMPKALSGALARIGDVMRLGPISTPALAQLDAGVATGPVTVTDHLPGLSHTPRGFSDFLTTRPAGTQDLWQARLYMLKPVLRIALVLLWLISGLLGLFLTPQSFLPLADGSGLDDSLLIAAARLGGVVDLALAAALFRGWNLRLLGWLQIGMVLAYTLSFTWLAPDLWLLPLGGLLKNPLILLLLVVFLILEDER